MSINIIVGGVRITKNKYGSLYNYGIGYKNTLPWGHLKEDMKIFRDFTTGKINMPKSNENEKNENTSTLHYHPTAIIMGRTTMESIPNFYLKNRTNYILTRNFEFYNKTPVSPNHIYLTLDNKHTLDTIKKRHKQVWVIGGSKIYNLFINNYIDEIDNIIINELVPTNKYRPKENDFDTFFPNNHDINYKSILSNARSFTKNNDLSKIVNIKEHQNISNIIVNVYSKDETTII